MKKIISFLLSASMLAGTVGTITVSAADTDITYTKPYLLTLDPDSEMDICWLTSGDGEGSIEIGETDALGETVKATQYKINGMRTSVKADGYDDEPTKNPELDVYQQIATVKNLKPNTTYYYRATTTVDGKTETTKTYNFKTAPEKGGDFTFALLSDLQMKAESPATVKQIGQNKATDNNYDKQPLEAFIDPLKKASRTGEGVEKLFNEDMSNIVEIMAQYYGITDLTDEEIEAIKNTEAGSMNYTVGPMISKRANIGWTTNGHTGEDVPLYIYAPENCKKLGGVVENTDIANYMADLFGVKLADATNTLFVQVRAAAEAKGAEVTWNNDDVQNPVVIITKGGDEIKIPINKNIAYVNGSVVKLDGVTVFNGINTYVPQSAIELIK